MRLNLAIRLATLVAVVGVVSNRQERNARTPLEVGDRAPEFEAAGTDGRIHRLADYRGSTVVLAWFIRAFTVHCWQEYRSSLDTIAFVWKERLAPAQYPFRGLCVFRNPLQVVNNPG